jgi:general stress protein 26
MANDDANTIKRADEKDEREVFERVENLRYAMLVTRDAERALSARPVTFLKVEPQGRFWFFVPIAGGIAHDIQRDSEVLLSVMDTDEDLFVSLTGHASVAQDPEKARELWSTMAGAWFPGGPDDPNLGILCVDVQRGDYWDVKASKLVRFYEMTKAALLKKTPENLGEHKRFTT